LAVFFCFALFCTINDDNGNPASPGTTARPPNPSDSGVVPGATLVPIITLEEEMLYARVNDTVQFRLTLRADTSAVAGVLPAKLINIVTSDTGNGNWISHPASITTNSAGQATFRFMSPREGRYTVTLVYNDGRPTSAVIIVGENQTRNFTIVSASPSLLAADGSSKSTITVLAKNATNNPIIDEVVTFTTDAGSITAQSVTDAEGRATAVLTSDRRNYIAKVVATLKSNGNSDSTHVEFAGVTITTTATIDSTSPGDSYTRIVTATLLDAGKRAIVGEPVIFTAARGTTTLTPADTLTNTRGEARIRLRASQDGKDTIFIRSAGAVDTVAVNFTGRRIVIDTTTPGNTTVNAVQGRRFHIGYLDGNDRGLRDEPLDVSVTIGSLERPTPDSTIFARTFTTNSDGWATFTIQNPSFATTGLVHIKSRNSDTENFLTFNIVASDIKNIRIEGTPAVIGTYGGEARITATVTDEHGNRVANRPISFNISRGPGGGERLEPAMAITAADGTITTTLIAGTIPSSFEGVEIEAAYLDMVASNKLRFTIAGAPHNITVRESIVPEDLIINHATFGLPISALVSDINHNPVPDGTEVTFITRVLCHREFEYNYTPTIDRYNNHPNRLPDVESEYIVDIDGLPRGNHQGTRYPTPSRRIDSSFTREEISFEDLTLIKETIVFKIVDTIDVVVDTVIITGSIIDTLKLDAKIIHITDSTVTKIPVIPDGVNVDENTVRITEQVRVFKETRTPVIRVFQEKVWPTDPGSCLPVDDRATAMLITRTVPTVGGIANNVLTYGQSDAMRFKVELRVEAQGLVTTALGATEFYLPEPPEKE